MIKDYFILAYRNLKKRKLRSWLTMLGIFVSIAAIFVLVALSLGLQAAVEEQFEQLGADKLFIQPKTGMMGLGSEDMPVELSLDDINIIEKISGVREATFMVMGNAKIEYNDKIRYYILAGMDVDDEDSLETLLESSGIKMDEGRFVEKGDINEIVIGSLYNDNNLFGKRIELRDIIYLNDVGHKVVGIAESVGNPGDDQNIYMAYKGFQELFDSSDRVDFIVVQIDEGADMDDVVAKIEKKLDNFRDVDEKTRDYSILTPEELLATFENILLIITAFLGGIAAIALFVGGIGIMNTMYTSVIERTKEIGIMKAVGAENKDILLLFLIESGLLGLIGGAIGVLLGIGIGKTVEYIAVHQLDTSILVISVPIWLVVSCLAFAFLAGTASGLAPAYRASKTNVVDALRYE